MSDRSVTLAVITGAHGVTGEVRLKLFCESADSLKLHKSFNAGSLTPVMIRAANHGATARFAEVADRTAAEKMRGIELTVPRDALPPLAEGEYYHADLIGLPAVSTTGEALGRVIAVENFGAGDVLEIERENGKRFMVAMKPEAVSEWSERVLIDERFVG